jgi:hypothetical protein
MTNDLIQVQGDVQDPKTLSVLAVYPTACLMQTDRAEVTLIINSQTFSNYNDIVHYLNADEELVRIASEKDWKKMDEYLLTRTYLKGYAMFFNIIVQYYISTSS